jgi:hypothetical protein
MNFPNSSGMSIGRWNLPVIDQHLMEVHMDDLLQSYPGEEDLIELLTESGPADTSADSEVPCFHRWWPSALD